MYRGLADAEQRDGYLRNCPGYFIFGCGRYLECPEHRDLDIRCSEDDVANLFPWNLGVRPQAFLQGLEENPRVHAG